MDSNVSGVPPGGINRVQPAGKRKQKQDDNKKAFKVDKGDASTRPPDEPKPAENLSVSEREEGESGGTLDLTA